MSVFDLCDIQWVGKGRAGGDQVKDEKFSDGGH
jgi:hypothetical protein